MQEQPRRRDHHRHVVAGLAGELAVDHLVPEAAARVLPVDAPGTALAAVVGGQRELDVVVEFAHALVHVGGAGLAGERRVVAGVEAGPVRAQAEALAGRVHELQRAGRAGARGRVHAAVGFLGHDAEQQRFRQLAALPVRVHLRAHVLVVLVAGDQRAAHVGQPAADARLHRRVVLDHLVEGVALVVQQRRGALGFRDGLCHRGMIAAIVERIDGGFLFLRATAVGRFLEQALVGGQQGVGLAAALLDAGIQHVLHVLQRGIGFGGALGVVVGHQHQPVAVALLGRGHARVQHFDGGLVLGRDPLGMRGRGQRQEGQENGQQGPGTQQGLRQGHQHAQSKTVAAG